MQSGLQSASEVAEKWRLLRDGVDKVIMGQDAVKEQLLVCLLAGGHALLEGVPGTAKTLVALTLSRLLGCRFRRIQFTPDLMPADLLGTSIYNQKTQQFELRPGPIFADLLLADEINRTPPRTQSALLEAMQEEAATVDGVRRVISPVFTVLATQNPVEFEGTYPLPEAQRDRFLMKIASIIPSAEEEAKMLSAYAGGRRLHEEAGAAIEPVLRPRSCSPPASSMPGSCGSRGTFWVISLGSWPPPASTTPCRSAPGRARRWRCWRAPRPGGAAGRDFVTPDDVKQLAARC